MDMNEHHDIQFLNTVLTRWDIRIGELWLQYFGLGGAASEFDIEAHLQALISLPHCERQLLQMAAEEIIATSQ
ncbi:hypothetical protein [[Micrococcus luteus] ATCC 49442]|uniref:hypothetical protein n=1 Tax=[Micrococcus luteus] ATCC 49442 TaxID=2698727 RepID=UPI0013D90982|nr:hypothetical protein [[Micrococcus luteus] ATCC 49442]